MAKLLRFLATNATVVNAYAAAELYGFPRVYRRVLEVLSADTHLSTAQKKRVASNIKTAIRVPSTAYMAVTESHTVAFLVREAEALATTTHVHVPPVVSAVAEMMFKRTPFGRVVDILKRAAVRREEDRRRRAAAHVGSECVSERVSERVSEQGGDRVSDQGSERESDRGSDRVSDRVGERGGDRVSERVGERGGDRVSERVSERGSDATKHP